MQNIELSEIEFMKLVSVASLHKSFFNSARKRDLQVGLSYIAQEILNEIFDVVLGNNSELKYKEQVKTILRTSGRCKLAGGII